MKSFTGTDAVLVEARSKTADRAELDERFDRLVAANGAALRRLAATYTNTVSDRDDLLQEIAIAIWKALPRFRGECSERTFVFRIAHNRGVAFLARTRAQVSGVADETQVHDPAPNPESGAIEGQRRERLAGAIHRLPIAYRQVMTLLLEGFDYAEIADVLGISETNVGARLTRARQILRSEMEEHR